MIDRKESVVPQSTGVPLIEGVPMPDTETIVRTIADTLISRLPCIPDGQPELLQNHAGIESGTETPPVALRQWDGMIIPTTDWPRFKPSIDAVTVIFETRCAAAARASCSGLKRLPDAGVSALGMRSLVSTTSECGWGHTDPARMPGLLESHRQVMGGR
jgi:hypothetical protein